VHLLFNTDQQLMRDTFKENKQCVLFIYNCILDRCHSYFYNSTTKGQTEACPTLVHAVDVTVGKVELCEPHKPQQHVHFYSPHTHCSDVFITGLSNWRTKQVNWASIYVSE